MLTVLKYFTDTIDDTCEILNEQGKDSNDAKLITFIKSTMSDLGPTNP